MTRKRIINRAFAIVLTLAMLISCGGVTAFADGASGVFASAQLVGDGSETNPYQISAAEELLLLQEQDEVGYAQLNNDIDLSGYEAQSYIINTLTGVFDGKGHTVSGLKLAGSAGTMWSGSVKTGFVSTLEGSVCNLKLKDVSISTESQFNDIGAVAGYASGTACSVKNCIVTGTITSTTESKYPAADYIGGMIGNTFGYYDTPTVVEIENCAVDVDVTGSAKDYTAGLVAYAAQNTTIKIKRCAVLGNVTADSAEGYAGGITGCTTGSSNVDISESYFAGTVSGCADCARSMVYMTKTGKNAGTLNYGENCMYTGTVEPNPEAETGTTVIGTAESKTEDELRGMTLEGFEIRDGEFDGFPVPIWTAAEPSAPVEPEFTCTVSFENLADGNVVLKKGENPISASNGVYTLTEVGEYNYTVTDFTDYTDISGTFTVTDADNGKSKTIWLHPEYKTVDLTGEGNEENPYVVSGAAELLTLAKLVNDGTAADSHVILNADITVNGSWTPMGKNATAPFRGVFDGGNHSVMVTVDEPTLSYFGFFGCLENATVKNLTVCGEIYCSEPYAYVGGVAARARGAVQLVNCVNRATISTYARGSAGIGGIVGGYDDNIEYLWENVKLSAKDCVNYGLINVSGTDLEVYAGGIVGSNKNCVQLDGCENHGTISSAGTWVGGLLGQAGSRMGDCEPKIANCESDGVLIGANGRTHRLYGKGTILSENITDSGDNSCGGGTTAENELLTEMSKYRDTAAVLHTAQAGTQIPILKDGMTVSDSITAEYTKGEKDITEGYIECGESGVTLVKQNTTQSTASETLTLRLTDERGNSLRKPITINIYPSENAARSLMDKIAAKYANKSDEWVVFDMSVYERLGFGANTTDKNGYLNSTVNVLSKENTDVNTRVKAEIIFAAAGIDSTALTAYGSETRFSNAEKLAASSLSTSIYNAPWILLAEEAGKTELSDEQRAAMIAAVTNTTVENGMFFYEWDGFKYYDPDTTATAITALARFYTSNESAAEFIDKAIAGLGSVQADNGSFGNVNSDAMVVIGLASMGVDPARDPRFVKDGGSLADAILLYANDRGDGFVSYGDADLATEQGFRALIVLEQMKSLGEGAGFNVYTLKAADGAAVVPEIPPTSYTASTDAGLKEEGSDEGAGSDSGSSSGSTKINVSLKVLDDSSSEWLSTSMSVSKGSTAADLIEKAFSNAGITAVGIRDGYIKSITKDGVTLGEFDKGDYSGWMYKINGKSPSVGITSYKLEAGDLITVYYTKDYRKDESSSKWSGGGSGSSSGVYTVKFVTGDETESDSVTVLKNGTADKPSTPTREGFVFEGWFTDKELTKPYDFSQKVTSNVTLYAKWTKAETNSSSGKGFGDVPSGAWYESAVNYAAGCGLMNGVSADSFAPEANVTRAMFVTILYRFSGSPAANKADFADVADDTWYTEAVAWAVANEIANGVSGTEFAPDENITREQLATLIYRYARSAGYDVSVGEDTNILSYTDYSEMSEYAIPAISYVVGAGIMNGKSDAEFAPKDTATRAEIAAVVMRFAKLAVKSEQ